MSFFGIRFGGPEPPPVSNPTPEAYAATANIIDDESTVDRQASFVINSESEGEREMTQEEVNQLVHDALRRARRATLSKVQAAAGDCAMSPLSDTSTPKQHRAAATIPPEGGFIDRTGLSSNSDPSQTHMDALLSPTMDSLIGSIGNSYSMMSTNSTDSVLRKVEEEIQAARRAALETTNRLRALGTTSESFNQPHELALSPTAELMEILDDHLADDEDLRNILDTTDDVDGDGTEVGEEGILCDDSFEMAQEEMDAEFAAMPPESPTFGFPAAGEDRRLNLGYNPEPEPDLPADSESPPLEPATMSTQPVDTNFECTSPIPEFLETAIDECDEKVRIDEDVVEPIFYGSSPTREFVEVTIDEYTGSESGNWNKEVPKTISDAPSPKPVSREVTIDEKDKIIDSKSIDGAIENIDSKLVGITVNDSTQMEQMKEPLDMNIAVVNTIVDGPPLQAKTRQVAIGDHDKTEQVMESDKVQQVERSPMCDVTTLESESHAALSGVHDRAAGIIVSAEMETKDARIKVNKSETDPAPPGITSGECDQMQQTNESELNRLDVTTHVDDRVTPIMEETQMNVAPVQPDCTTEEATFLPECSEVEEKKDEDNSLHEPQASKNEQILSLPFDEEVQHRQSLSPGERETKSLAGKVDQENPQEEGVEADDVLIRLNSGVKSKAEYADSENAITVFDSDVRRPPTHSQPDSIIERHKKNSKTDGQIEAMTAARMAIVESVPDRIEGMSEENMGVIATTPKESGRIVRSDSSDYTEVTVSDVPQIGRDVVVSAEGIINDDVSEGIVEGVESDYTEETVTDGDEMEEGVTLDDAVVDWDEAIRKTRPFVLDAVDEATAAKSDVEVFGQATQLDRSNNSGLKIETKSVTSDPTQLKTKTIMNSDLSPEGDVDKDGLADEKHTIALEGLRSDVAVDKKNAATGVIAPDAVTKAEQREVSVKGTPTSYLVEGSRPLPANSPTKSLFVRQQIAQVPDTFSATSPNTERSTFSLAPTSDKIYFRDPYPFPPPLPKPRPASTIIQEHQLGIPEAFAKWSRSTPELETLLSAVRGDSLQRRSNACGALKVLTQEKKNQLALVRTEGFLDALVFAINASAPHKLEVDMVLGARGRAVSTLLKISEPKGNRQLVCVHAGVVSSLLQVILADLGESRVQACATIATLAKTASNREFLVTVPGLLNVLAIALLGSRTEESLCNEYVDKKESTDFSLESGSDIEGQATISLSSPEDDGTHDDATNFDEHSHSDGTSLNDDEHTSLAVSSSMSSVQPTDRDAPKQKSIRDQKDALQDQFVLQARVNACASLMHLSKHCAISNCLATNKVLIKSIVDVSTEFDNPIHTKCLEMLCNLTRFPANIALLARDVTLIEALIRAGKSKKAEDRTWAMRCFQNLASDSSSKAILATSRILTLLSVCSMRKEADEQVAAVAALYNLSTEPGAVVPLTNTRNVVATLVHLAHNPLSNPDVRKMACDTLATIGLWLQTLAGSGAVPKGIPNVLLPTHTSSGWRRWD